MEVKSMHSKTKNAHFKVSSKQISEFKLLGKITWIDHYVSSKGVHRTVARLLNYDPVRDRKHAYFVTFFEKVGLDAICNCNVNDSVCVGGILNNNVYENKDGVLRSETQLIGLSYQHIDDIEIPIKPECSSESE